MKDEIKQSNEGTVRPFARIQARALTSEEIESVAGGSVSGTSCKTTGGTFKPTDFECGDGSCDPGNEEK